MSFIYTSKTSFLFLIIYFLVSLSWAQSKLLNWSANGMSAGTGSTWSNGGCTPVTGSTSCRPHPWAPINTNSAITLTQNLTYSGTRTALTPAVDCWGGSSGGSWNNQFFSFKFTVNDAYLKLERLGANIRRSNAGPSTIEVTYRIGSSGIFKSLGFWSGFSTSGIGTHHFIDFNLINHADLRNLTTGDIVEFRFMTANAQSGSNLYFGGSEALYLTLADNPLPVQLTHFAATCVNNNTVINWKTASELNNDYFEVEKSENAIDFFVLDRINGAGNSNIELTYEWHENSYLRGKYYRLKQVDYDGKTTFYTPIYFEGCKSSENSIKLLSSSAQENVVLQFQNQEDELVNINVFTINGVCIYQTQKNIIAGAELLEINTAAWQSGLYIIQIASQLTNKSLKYLKI